GRTPGGPNVEEDRPASELGELDWLSLKIAEEPGEVGPTVVAGSARAELRHVPAAAAPARAEERNVAHPDRSQGDGHEPEPAGGGRGLGSLRSVGIRRMGRGRHERPPRETLRGVTPLGSGWNGRTGLVQSMPRVSATRASRFSTGA